MRPAKTFPKAVGMNWQTIILVVLEVVFLTPAALLVAGRVVLLLATAGGIS